eukprot:TRINITY_DN10983_c0_g1_i2.p2 TRINITY_DN10983_c0_g1~~TRINITY_DN10983_c0_g1_i2.p2  ORF type:complete len:543 (-),score=40.21 TRINITY_DN10983_c0_g1_i2:38-1624(-)
MCIRDREIEREFLKLSQLEKVKPAEPLKFEYFRFLLPKFGFDLTKDEQKLFYFLITKSCPIGILQRRFFVSFIQDKCFKPESQPIQYNKPWEDKEAEKAVGSSDKYPFVFREVLRIGYVSGKTQLFQMFDTIVGGKDKIEFPVLADFVFSMNIQANGQQLNQFKLWLSKEGLIGLDGYDTENKPLLHVKLGDLKEHITGILDQVAEEKGRQSDKLEIFLQKDNDDVDHIKEFHYSTVKKALANFEKKLNLVCASDRYIEEYQLKVMFLDAFSDMDAVGLNSIISLLEYTKPPTRICPQRRIFVDEFIYVLKGRQKFRIYDTTEIFKDEKAQKQHQQQAAESIGGTKVSPNPVDKIVTEQETKKVQFQKMLFATGKRTEEDTENDFGPCELPIKIAQISDLQIGNILRSKVYPILELLQSKLSQNNEEKGVLFLPLLKILRYNDIRSTGVVKVKDFQKIVNEYFKDVTPNENQALAYFALNTSEVVDNQNGLNAKQRNLFDQRMFTYYNLVMTLEKICLLYTSPSPRDS